MKVKRFVRLKWVKRFEVEHGCFLNVLLICFRRCSNKLDASDKNVNVGLSFPHKKSEREKEREKQNARLNLSLYISQRCCIKTEKDRRRRRKRGKVVERRVRATRKSAPAFKHDLPIVCI